MEPDAPRGGESMDVLLQAFKKAVASLNASLDFPVEEGCDFEGAPKNRKKYRIIEYLPKFLHTGINGRETL
jgi:hypothetical protein